MRAIWSMMASLHHLLVVLYVHLHKQACQIRASSQVDLNIMRVTLRSLRSSVSAAQIAKLWASDAVQCHMGMCYNGLCQ